MLDQFLSPQGRLSLRAHQRQKQAAPAAWTPDPRNKPQCAAYHTSAFELLYGGAAGGGKSDLLLGLARNRHQASLLLRREFPDLKRTLIERSLQFFGDRDLYNASDHVWRIEARRIEFGHLNQLGTATHPGDEQQYASAQYDLIGFDQLEQFSQYAYEFMFSRARSVVKNQCVQIVATANPAGEYIEWIIQRWGAWLDEKHPNPAQSGEIRWYKRLADGREVETTADDPDGLSRTFIAASLKDNPYLPDEYRRTLTQLPEPLRSALLHGDWKASIVDDAYQVIPRAWVKAAMARWRADGKPRNEAGESIRLTNMAADIARGGDDKEVIAERYGNWVAELTKIPGYSVPDGARAIKPILERLEQLGEAMRTGESIHYPDAQIDLPIVQSDVPIAIDVIGVGSSAYDTGRNHHLNVIGVNWSEASKALDKSKRLKFVNKRAEQWWSLREALDPSNEDNRNAPLMLPPDPELLADLCAPRWSSQSNGIKIESKEEIKERLGRSPDCGDAVVMVNAATGASFLVWVKHYQIENQAAAIAPAQVDRGLQNLRRGKTQP